MYFTLLLSVFASLRLVSSHVSIWHPSMWGFNVTRQTFDYDNRPVAPLMHLSFQKWWFHNHLGHPPHPEDVFELPAGRKASTQIACNKGATTFYASSEGGNVQEPDNPNNVCPGSPPTQYHTKGIDDVKGCALAIAYKSDASQVKPEDFVVFSVNQTCVWNRYTDFAVPDRMPPCPNNLCTCAFFWIHSPDSGAEQNYMNGFQCTITDSTSNVGLASAKVARRCGADADNGKLDAVSGNCTYGAKQPFYWFQAEQNNMFEGPHAPPFYNDLYNFKDGAQDDIFQDSYKSMPVPGPNQTALPVLAAFGAAEPATAEPATAEPVTAEPATAEPATASDGSTTPLRTSSTPSSSAGVTAPSETSSSSTQSQCMMKRDASALPRNSVQTERGTTFLKHRMGSMIRQRRPLNPERKSNFWKPF